MADLSQDGMNIRVTTSLGAGKFRFRSFAGTEAMSELFGFSVAMIASDSNLDFKSMLGKTATLTLDLSAGGNRFINGNVISMTVAGGDEDSVVVTVELAPWLWELGLEADCRIFQNKTTIDIIKAVFDELGYTDYEDKTSGTYAERVYCVQYNETSLAFVSRLMEEEGIVFFFKHEDGKHTLVLADDVVGLPDCPEMTVAYYKTTEAGYARDDLIESGVLARAQATGTYQTGDYDFETPSTDLTVKAKGAGDGPRTVYDWPGPFKKKPTGQTFADRRIEGLEKSVELLDGAGSCRFFTAGHVFEMKDHPRDALNGKYAVRRVSHSGDDRSYSNTFTAHPKDTPFRAPRVTRKPRIAGAQTALVTGQSGKEIWTDEHGRIKVQFHWDQLGQKDEKTSCWIRVAQMWAGKGWGSWFIPRIGMEVVVTFIDGDPDRPLVTGCVYNGDNTLPYALPGEQTKSTIKSNSSTGGAGYNEIRFEDKADAEEIFIHARKDMNTEVEKGNRTATIMEGNETLTVSKGDRTVSVDTGKEIHTVKDTRDVTVEGDETHTNKGNFTHTVDGDYSLTVKGKLTIEVTGDVSIKSDASVTVESGTTTDVKAGTALTAKSGTDATVQSGTGCTVKGGTTLTLQGTASGAFKAPTIDVKADGMATVDGGGMLTLKGGLVKVN